MLTQIVFTAFVSAFIVIVVIGHGLLLAATKPDGRPGSRDPRPADETAQTPSPSREVAA
jgi:hypothetical protein